MAVIPQPDGSVACIPYWMLREAAARHTLCDEPRFGLNVIRALRVEVDALFDILQLDLAGEDVRNDAQYRQSSARSIRGRRATGSACDTTKGPPGKVGPSSSRRNCGGTGRWEEQE
jgi:hypothetical protein